jgi:eukaryotic-like serine/threonine-protein kinase
MVMDATLSDPLVGRLLEGRYAVEAFIAHGGMASVYIATDTRLERRVAVKVLHAHLSGDDETVARFEREARAAARLSHPDVVAVYDQGTEAGRAYLVMEYVPGANLRQIIRSRGRLSPAEALAVMDHVLAALAAAHRAGLVHRDVKPENVLVTADGRVKVADFGLARAITGTTVTTSGGVLLGTAAYVAPEQFEHGTADTRSDVYSAGVVLFELLTGTPPFEAENAYALLNRHATEDVPAPSTRATGIPPQLDALVTWATSRQPSERPADAAELHDSLVDVRDRLRLHGAVPLPPVQLTSRFDAVPTGRATGGTGATVVADRPARPSPTAARRRRRRGLITALAVALIAVAAGIVGWWFAAGRYVNVPNVMNASKTEATQQLSAAGLHAHWLPDVHSARIPEGKVAAVSPSDRVVRGGTVDVRLSSGPVTHPIPSVTDESVKTATSDLQGAGFKVASGLAHAHSTTVRTGKVAGTTPKSGVIADAGSTVTLIVSLGEPTVVVPQIDGLQVSTAQDALTHAGLLTTSPQQVYNNTVPAGQVISATPNQGTSAVRGSTVQLVVSKGPHLYLVPNVEGQGIDAAIKTIQEAGFTPDPHQVLPGGPNLVLREDHDGSMEPHGTSIRLYYF